MSFLRVSHLSRRWGRAEVVNDVTFEVEKGQILGLVGPNGAGKSTLLEMLATVLRPSSGSIALDGVNAVAKPYAVRRRIGYVPGVFGVPPDVKVWEFLDFYARCHGLKGRFRQTTIAELLKLVDLFEFRFAFCGSLSRGMQQKLMVIRALVNDPDLLILDEPLAGMDPESRLEMLEVIRELGSIGKSIVLSSYAIGELVDVCDRIGIMAAGRLTSLGTVPELIRELDPVQRVIMHVLDSSAEAQRLLDEMDNVSDVSVENRSLTFVCQGGQAAVAGVLQKLIVAGVQVVQFSAVARPVEASISEAPKTAPSAEQLRP